MFMIIFYHLIFFIVARNHRDIPFWHSFQLAIHTGVILFVLISGYFGIKTSTKGFVRLLLLSMVYYVPIVLVDNLILKEGLTAAEKWQLVLPSFQAVTKSPYWFLRTYMWLYLLAPLANKFFEANPRRNKLALLLICGAISLYAGYNGVDGSITDGKNIINFFFLYALGSILHDTYDKWSKWKTWILLTAFLGLCIALVYTHLRFDGSWYSTNLWQMAYPYNSPILMVVSVLAFMLFGKIKIQSKAVNWVAASTFSMYLIHRNPVVLERVLRPVVTNTDVSETAGILPEIGILLLLTVAVFVISLVIDKLLDIPLKKAQAALVRWIDRILEKTGLKESTH
ncbi:MAG: acyltransferase [Bacteroidales bacterium]|nr:acyltransferase [Bacteroidales bacterium]